MNDIDWEKRAKSWHTLMCDATERATDMVVQVSLLENENDQLRAEVERLRALVTRARDIMKRSVWDEYAACEPTDEDSSFCRYCHKVIEDGNEWFPHEETCPVKDARKWVADVENAQPDAPADTTMTGGAYLAADAGPEPAETFD